MSLNNQISVPIRTFELGLGIKPCGIIPGWYYTVEGSEPLVLNLFPAQTLQNLLNPELANNDLDPYGAAFLKDHGCEDEGTLVVIRSGAQEHLEIDSIVNLAEPKLIAQFDNSHSSASSAPKAVAAQTAPNTLQKWSAANTNWASSDNFDF